jgi:hypothetical protein
MGRRRTVNPWDRVRLELKKLANRSDGAGSFLPAQSGKRAYSHGAEEWVEFS